MTSFKNMIYLALFFAIAMSFFNAVFFDIRYALLSFPISLLVFGLPIFLFSRPKKNSITQEIDTIGQKIIYSGPATHYVNSIGIGGTLYLTTDKIEFLSHVLPVQDHRQVLMINQISTVKSCKILGVVPNALLITTNSGELEKFAVSNNRYWKEEIEALLNQVDIN